MQQQQQQQQQQQLPLSYATLHRQPRSTVADASSGLFDTTGHYHLHHHQQQQQRLFTSHSQDQLPLCDLRRLQQQDERQVQNDSFDGPLLLQQQQLRSSVSSQAVGVGRSSTGDLQDVCRTPLQQQHSRRQQRRHHRQQQQQQERRRGESSDSSQEEEEDNDRGEVEDKLEELGADNSEGEAVDGQEENGGTSQTKTGGGAPFTIEGAMSALKRRASLTAR